MGPILEAEDLAPGENWAAELLEEEAELLLLAPLLLGPAAPAALLLFVAVSTIDQIRGFLPLSPLPGDPLLLPPPPL